MCTFFGLIEAVAHYDGLAALYLFIISIVGSIIIWRPHQPPARTYPAQAAANRLPNGRQLTAKWPPGTGLGQPAHTVM